LKNALAIVALSLLLPACAQLQPPASSAARPETAAVSPAPVVEAAEKPAATLPDVALTEDIMVKLLSAEIGFQRGEWQFAYVTLLGLAQQTRDPRLAQRAAEVALNARRAAEALAAVRLWRELAPDSEQARQYYLGFIILSDDPEEAQPILAERLQQATPKTRGSVILQIQRTLASAKDKAAAFSMLDALVTPYLALPEAHLALAQAAFSNGDGARAMQEAQLAISAKPDSELAILTLAQVAPDKTAATQDLASFLQRYPKAREVRIAYARLLTEQKLYEQARGEFNTLLKADPQDLTSLFALGILSAQLDDSRGAERYLTSYIQILASQPDEARDPTQALLLLAQLAQDRKDTDAALKWLSQIEPGPAYLSAQIRSAQLIAARGQIDAARKMLAEIPTDGEREQTQVILAEGQILRDAGRVPEALALLQNAVQRAPDNTDLLYDYAMLAEKLDKLEVMEKALRKIIELAPKNQHAYNALGYSLAERNLRLPEALQLIETALQLAPDDPFILDSMGWVQYRLGKLPEAEKYLQRAYALQPDAEIGVHLGEVLWVKGQRDAAEKLWRDARTKDPQNDALKNTLARLQVQL